MLDFVSFHNHTTYSIMDSLIKPSELFKKVKELEQSAIAVTDHATLAGAWDCLKYSKEAGVKLIIGCEFYFVDDLSQPYEGRLRHIILCAKNEKGYKNLLLANKLANDNNIIAFKKVFPRIDWKILEQVQEGLICTTACGSGILSQLFNTRRADEAKLQVKRLKDIFGDNLALEIQPHAMKRNANAYNDYEDQSSVNRQLIKLGDEFDIKVIPTFDAHYLTKDQWEAHDVLLAIGAGQPVRSGARLKYDNEFFLRTRQEVKDFFARLYPTRAEQFCDNTLYFADKCESPDWIDPKYSNPSGKELPEFPVKNQDNYNEFLTDHIIESSYFVPINYDAGKSLKEDEAYLRWWCEKEFLKKIPLGKEVEYRARLKEEFEVIEFHGFSSYMLIVADYINYCKNNNIPVGPGRGSVGGSLIAYLLGIHQADPIKYKLIFARFHNKEKTSFPDIDTDFAPSGRDSMQAYIRRKYGEDHVAHVSNVNTMTPKVYARDIARAFEYGGDRKSAVATGTMLADAIPTEIKTLDEAFEKAGLFDEMATKKYPELKKFAPYLGGKSKAWSTHAGGIVIGKRPLAEIVPTRRDKEGSVSVEYDKDRAEMNGLVKMDTLGLETLDIIQNTYKLIAMANKPLPPYPPNFDEYDEETYDLISRGDTLCVFQLGGSAGTVDLCRKVKPKTIEDISIINSLARPSARDIRSDFIATKDGKKSVDLLDPSLERAFGGTYGFGLYEECLMYLAQDVAGWDLHEADQLRKLTKEKGKNPKKAAKLKKEFIEGSVKNGITENKATKIWDEVVDKFQGYGFNLSHSILYSFISYHTAYLKAHYPLEFLTANLMSEVKSNAKSAVDNITKIKNEIRKLNVKILPPDINQSEMSYKIIDDNTLMTGLDSLKFIGKDAIPEILKKRPFKSFENFLSSVDGRKVKAPAVQALAASGCLDSFGMSRKLMFLYAADYKKKLSVWLKKNREVGNSFNYPWPSDVGEWSIPERYAMEIFYLGEGLTGDLYQVYPGFFDNRALNFTKLPSFFPEPAKDAKKEDQQCSVHSAWGTIEGVIKNTFEFKVKKEGSKIFGETMARVIIQDPFGNSVGLTIFPRKLQQLHERFKELKGSKVKLESGTVVHIAGSINWYEGDVSILFDDLKACAPPPAVPADLKPKKVSMRITGGTKKSKKADPDEILEEIEDELIEEGLAESSSLDDDSSNEEENFDDEDRLDGFI